jgi:hypothetical protein
MPYRDGKPLPGGFKLGINPALVKHEGTQPVLWGEEGVKNGVVNAVQPGQARVPRAPRPGSGGRSLLPALG